MDTEVDQDIVVLNVKKGTCFGLNAVSSRIWRLIENPVRIRDLCMTLLTEFEIDFDTCQQQVLSVLNEMYTEGMIRVDDPSVDIAKS